jgi:adenosylhomocysteine nucleosidase
VKLHRTISIDRPLLVVALEEEARHLHAADLPVLVTGVGKIRAAWALAAVLAKQRPSSVINLGTAGALNDNLRGTHLVSRVIQHDYDHQGISGLTGTPYGGAPIDLRPEGLVLASGDRFVEGGPERDRLTAAGASLVDMEGYAVAMVAREFGLEVTLVKEVSDTAGAGAASDWRRTLDACAARLGGWLSQYRA